MKRLSSLLLALALLCALALPAAADVAYMPRDNFIEKHWQDCRYENRWYWTNGAAGYVLAHKTPDSKEATPLPNGGIYYISNVYQGKWGVLEYNPDTLENTLWNGSVSGWVDMDEMVADYDNDAFTADHRAELSDAQAELALGFSDVAYGYKYPGSGIVTDEFSGQNYTEPFLLAPLFTDPAGRTWGFVGYYYGRHDCWICIDDPHNGALPPDENCVSIVTRDAAQPTDAPSPTEAPAPTQTPVPGPTQSPAPTQTPAPDPTQSPAPAQTPTLDPAQSPAPVGRTVELTPSADPQTLQQAAKDNRGSGPYIAAGAGGVVVIAAAVLVAALRKKRK